MLDYNKIAKTINNRNFTLKEFIPKVTGLTVQGFKKSIQNKTLKVSDLEKISRALNLEISFWWENENSEPSGQSIASLGKNLYQENKKLSDDLERKNKIIDKLFEDIAELNTKMNFIPDVKGIKIHKPRVKSEPKSEPKTPKLGQKT